MLDGISHSFDLSQKPLYMRGSDRWACLQQEVRSFDLGKPQAWYGDELSRRRSWYKPVLGSAQIEDRHIDPGEQRADIHLGHGVQPLPDGVVHRIHRP